MKEVRSAFKSLTDKPIGNSPLGRPRRRWEENILKEMGVNIRNQDRDYKRAFANAAFRVSQAME